MLRQGLNSLAILYFRADHVRAPVPGVEPETDFFFFMRKALFKPLCRAAGENGGMHFVCLPD
jgi:hypothetical protein